MPRQNIGPESAPAAVAQVVTALGANIATARVRRSLTLEDLAAKAGLSKETISRVEAGRLTTSIGAYAAALWVLGLHQELGAVGHPENDAEGRALASGDEKKRVRRSRRLSDDF